MNFVSQFFDSFNNHDYPQLFLYNNTYYQIKNKTILDFVLTNDRSNSPVTFDETRRIKINKTINIQKFAFKSLYNYEERNFSKTLIDLIPQPNNNASFNLVRGKHCLNVAFPLQLANLKTTITVSTRRLRSFIPRGPYRNLQTYTRALNEECNS